MARNPRNQIYPGYEDLPAPRGSGPLTRLWRFRTELLLLAGLALLVPSRPGRHPGGQMAPVRPAEQRRLGAGRDAVRPQLGRRALLVRGVPPPAAAGLPGDHPAHPRLAASRWCCGSPPTATGEKALILTRAGISAEEFEAYAEEIAAACWARTAAVYKHRTRANLVIVEVVRRDVLPGAVSPGLDRLYGRADLDPAPARPRRAA
ncbi:hypothetical protein ACFSTC_55155 [Nonomuraea ferruginea]